MVFDKRHVAKEIAQRHQRADPSEAAQHAKQHKTSVGHMADSGDKGRKGAHYRQKTRQGNGFAAVALIKGLGALQIITAEDFRVGIAKQSLAAGATNPIIGAIPLKSPPLSTK